MHEGMSPFRLAAILTVTVALVLYTLGTIKGQRAHRATPGVRGFMSVGLVFDVLATLQMIRLAGTLVPGFHGVLGYSSLTLMAIEVGLIWRHWRAQGGAEIPRGQRTYAWVAYVYWVIAFLVGGAMEGMAHHAGS